MVVAFAGFYFNNVWLALLAMFLLGTQSAFFGPAKYGVIPELVADSKISMANATSSCSPTWRPSLPWL